MVPPGIRRACEHPTDAGSRETLQLQLCYARLRSTDIYLAGNATGGTCTQPEEVGGGHVREGERGKRIEETGSPPRRSHMLYAVGGRSCCARLVLRGEVGGQRGADGGGRSSSLLLFSSSCRWRGWLVAEEFVSSFFLFLSAAPCCAWATAGDYVGGLGCGRLLPRNAGSDFC